MNNFATRQKLGRAVDAYAERYALSLTIEEKITLVDDAVKRAEIELQFDNPDIRISSEDVEAFITRDLDGFDWAAWKVFYESDSLDRTTVLIKALANHTRALRLEHNALMKEAHDPDLFVRNVRYYTHRLRSMQHDFMELHRRPIWDEIEKENYLTPEAREALDRFIEDRDLLLEEQIARDAPKWLRFAFSCEAAIENDAFGTLINNLVRQEPGIREWIESQSDPAKVDKTPSYMLYDRYTDIFNPLNKALDREPGDLTTDTINQAEAATQKFENMLDRDTLIGYLKAAQEQLGLKTQLQLAEHLGVTPPMVRKAYAGKASIDTLTDFLSRCGVTVQIAPIGLASIQVEENQVSYP